MKTTEEWRRLGKDDPLFAVAAHPGTRGAWVEEDFYRLGREDWEQFLGLWQQYEPSVGGTCVEIGSGAGRITQGLVDHFDRVIGLDVSPDMVELARKAAPEADFKIVDGTRMPLSDDSTDAVFSCHVLQHLESLKDVTDYMFEARRVLRPGGTAMIHLLLNPGEPSLPRRAKREAKLRLTRALKANRGAYSRVRKYRPDEVRESLERVGFTQVEMREFRTRSNNGEHAFWFARAEAGARF